MPLKPVSFGTPPPYDLDSWEEHTYTMYTNTTESKYCMVTSVGHTIPLVGVLSTYWYMSVNFHEIWYMGGFPSLIQCAQLAKFWKKKPHPKAADIALQPSYSYATHALHLKLKLM